MVKESERTALEWPLLHFRAEALDLGPTLSHQLAQEHPGEVFSGESADERRPPPALGADLNLSTSH